MGTLSTKTCIGGVSFDSADVSNQQLEAILRAPDLSRYIKANPDYVAEEFKSFLKDVLISRMTYFHPVVKSIFSRKSDPTFWIHDTRRNAAKYLRSTWAHNPWLTKYFIADLLECQLEGLTYRVSVGIYPEFSLRNMQEPYASILATVFGIAVFIALGGLLYYLLDHEHIGWAAVVGLYIVYHYVLKVRQVFFRAKAKAKMAEQIESLSIIQYEVSIEAYDPDIVSRRLEALETKGVYPFSPIFPLLQMAKADLTTTITGS